MSAQILTQERLKELLHYNPDTGIFIWIGLNARARRIKIGDVAGCVLRNRIRIRTHGKAHYAHRLAWLYVNGEWPNGEIDHINHDPQDNRIDNLRVVNHQTNGKNQKFSISNTSGATGIYWYKRGKKWQASIRVNGGNIHLGYFVNYDDAVAVRKNAEISYGFHKNHGK